MIKYESNNNRVVYYDNNNVIGECIFKETKDYINIIHTYVDPSYRGYGIARKLVNKVIDISNSKGKKIIADCSYAKNIIK